ncbi:MAG: ArsR/SmtB family transcription factor [Planctomycetota bacterium]|jgi:ArsR family transcriptional regulator
MIGLEGATELLKALGDPTRVRLLALLEADELTVAELTRITELTQSRVSTHLGRLKQQGFVLDRPNGASTYYRAAGTLMPEEARRVWELVRDRAEDPLLDGDRRRLDRVVRGRARTWADSVAGQMERHYSPGRTWEATLRGLLGLVRLGSVLDVASGDCAIAELLAPRADRITCLDNSATVLRAGRARMKDEHRVGFVRGDMHQLPSGDARFDQVLLLACLCYADDPELVLKEAARVLKPGGVVVGVSLHSHSHRELVAKYDHVRTGFTPQELHDLMQSSGLTVGDCRVTARERRAPHFETISFHATK